MLAALAAKVAPFTLFETRRLVGALVGLIGLAATWRTGRRIGGPLAGLCALVLLATCPLYIGHMFMNAKDAPFAVAMAILLLALVRAFETYPRIAPATGALTGAGFGLSIGSRVMGGFGVVDLAGALALLAILQARLDGLRPAAARLGRFVLALCRPPCWPMRSWRWSGPGRWSIRSIRCGRSRISRTSSRSPGTSCSPASS